MYEPLYATFWGNKQNKNIYKYCTVQGKWHLNESKKKKKVDDIVDEMENKIND